MKQKLEIQGKGDRNNLDVDFNNKKDKNRILSLINYIYISKHC